MRQKCSVCKDIYIYIYSYICLIDTDRHVDIHKHTCMYTCVYVHTHTHIYIYIEREREREREREQRAPAHNRSLFYRNSFTLWTYTLNREAVNSKLSKPYILSPNMLAALQGFNLQDLFFRNRRSYKEDPLAGVYLKPTRIRNPELYSPKSPNLKPRRVIAIKPEPCGGHNVQPEAPCPKPSGLEGAACVCLLWRQGLRKQRKGRSYECRCCAFVYSKTYIRLHEKTYSCCFLVPGIQRAWHCA